MINKQITYTDFNGDKQTDTFYFNLTKAELIELNMSADGGIEEAINTVIRSRNNSEIHQMFKKIIGQAYGVKSVDGRFFRKSPEILAEFEATEAYSELIMEMFTDTAALAAFVIGLMPADLVEKAGLKDAVTPDEIRRASLAAKGGYQQKQEPKSSVKQEPELPTQGSNTGSMGEPTVTNTAPAIFEDKEAEEGYAPVRKSPFDGLTNDQIAEKIRSGEIKVGQ